MYKFKIYLFNYMDSAIVSMERETIHIYTWKFVSSSQGNVFHQTQAYCLNVQYN